MLVEGFVAAELLGAVTWTLVQGPRSFRSVKSSPTPTVPTTDAPTSDDTYTIPPVVITPDAPVSGVDCKVKIDAFVAKLPEETRDIFRAALAAGNSMQIDALATEVEKVDPTLAACLRAQKKM